MIQFWLPFFTMLALLFSSLMGLARPLSESQALLLNRQTRPTVQEFLDAFEGQLPESNPFVFDATLRWRNPGRTFQPNEDQFRQLVFEQGARTIARMEKAFSDARWAGVGRDVATLGDLLDAFYSSKGQTDRVARLDVSTGSFTVDDILIDYLKQKGAPLETGKISESRPFVAFDRTSFGSWRTSQSQLILQAGYQYFQNHGGNLKDLVRKFNFITTEPVSIGGSSASNRGINAEVIGADNVEPFLQGQENDINHKGSPSRLLAIGSDLSDLAEWHESFGTIYRDNDGIIQPQPGAVASAELRNRVLWEMYEVIKISSGDDFYRKVQDAARLLNFNFVVFNSKEVSEKLQLLNRKLDEKTSLTIDDLAQSFKDLPRCQPVKEFLDQEYEKIVSKITDKDSLKVALNVVFAANPEAQKALLREKFKSHVKTASDLNNLNLSLLLESQMSDYILQLPLSPEELAQYISSFSSVENGQWQLEILQQAAQMKLLTPEIILNSDFHKQNLTKHFLMALTAVPPSLDQIQRAIIKLSGHEASIEEVVQWAMTEEKVDRAALLLEWPVSTRFVLEHSKWFIAHQPNSKNVLEFVRRSRGTDKEILVWTQMLEAKLFASPQTYLSLQPSPEVIRATARMFMELVPQPTIEEVNQLTQLHPEIEKWRVFNWEKNLSTAPATLRELILTEAFRTGVLTSKDFKKVNLPKWATRSRFFRSEMKTVKKSKVMCQMSLQGNHRAE